MRMQRREFLMTTAAAVGALKVARPAAGVAQQAADPRKLARISMMTLNFTTLLKTPHQPPSPDRTLDLFDLPQMYIDTYGVHNVELMHYHMASTEMSFFKAMRERMDRTKSQTTQLVVEFGGLNISAPDHNFLPRLQAIDLTKVWIDRCETLACPRIMVNQGMPTPENKAYAVETMAAMVAYGKTKGVKVTMETRGGGPAAAAGAPAWPLLNDIAQAAGGYINIDLGGIGAANQDDLHAALRALLPNSSGSMHVKSSNNWDLAAALKFIEAQGYTGLYSIEAPGHERTRAIYDTLLATI
jgi:sugar phosphate isomerase/epimerase